MEAQDYTITGLRAVRENLVSQRSPAEVLGNAGVPAEHIFTTQGSLAMRELTLTIAGLIGCEGAHLYNTGLIGWEGAHLCNTGLIGCEGVHLYNTGLIGCERAHSYNRRAHCCEGELVDAALSCGSPLVTQRPPARQTRLRGAFPAKSIW
jgi:hypothetical protein